MFTRSNSYHEIIVPLILVMYALYVPTTCLLVGAYLVSPRYATYIAWLTVGSLLVLTSWLTVKATRIR